MDVPAVYVVQMNLVQWLFVSNTSYTVDADEATLRFLSHSGACFCCVQL